MKSVWKSTTAGILTMIAGTVGIISGALNIAVGASAGLGTSWASAIPALGGFGMMSLGLGIVWIIMGVIALLGGIRARRRQSWGFALAGAILAVPLFIPLGVLAIVFVVLGKREFSH